MKKNLSASLLMFTSSLISFMLIYNSHSWTNILLGSLLAIISLLIAFFMFILKDLKEKSPKRVTYLIILVLGVLFLALGLMV